MAGYGFSHSIYYYPFEPVDYKAPPRIKQYQEFAKNRREIRAAYTRSRVSPARGRRKYQLIASKIITLYR